MAADSRRVVWFEGMVLDPHHLQQMDRHQRTMLQARLRAAQRFDWGFTALDIDEERLTNGDFVLRSARGVLPDGLWVDMPGETPLPAARPIHDLFPPTRDVLTVFLAIPAERTGGANILLNGTEQRRETRYSALTTQVVDETTGAEERPIDVAQTNVSIRVAGETLDAYVTLPLAEIVRDASGHYRLQDGFIPPVLRIGASAQLAALSNRLSERLFAKHAELAARWRSAGAQRELTPADVTAQALLNTVAEFAPRIEHLRASNAHPEDLFREMLGLAGRLSAAVPEASVSPREFPAYAHAEPSKGFAALTALIERLLGGAAPRANYTRIPFTRISEGLSTAKLDGALLSGNSLFLAVRHPSMSSEQLANELVSILRVASPDTIDAVLRSYTRALPVDVATRLPSALPVDRSAGYFELKRSGPFWDAIREAGALSVFVPSEYAAADLELLAIGA